MKKKTGVVDPATVEGQLDDVSHQVYYYLRSSDSLPLFWGDSNVFRRVYEILKYSSFPYRQWKK